MVQKVIARRSRLSISDDIHLHLSETINPRDRSRKAHGSFALARSSQLVGSQNGLRRSSTNATTEQPAEPGDEAKVYLCVENPFTALNYSLGEAMPIMELKRNYQTGTESCAGLTILTANRMILQNTATLTANVEQLLENEAMKIM